MIQAAAPPPPSPTPAPGDPQLSSSTAGLPVRCLSVHAHYRCGHSGTCCTNGWAVPVEASLHGRLAEAVASGRVEVPGARRRRGADIFQTGEGLPEGSVAVLAHARSGDCIFFDRPDRHLCAIHRDAGPDLLPSACRHFPRLCLIDPLGVSITLSHYCPTAARLLIDDTQPLALVVDPPAFGRRPDYEGLDAREAWPPLVRPDALFDLESLACYEAHLVATLGRTDLSPEAALRLLAGTAEVVRAWQAPTALATHVRQAIEAPAVGAAPGDLSLTPALYRLVLACVGPGLRAPRPLQAFERAWGRWVQPAWGDMAAPVRKYLAAKAFANWCLYQGQGVRTVLFSLVAALAVLRVEAARAAARAGRPLDNDLLVQAFRAADLLLVHLAVRERLAEWFSRIEHQPPEYLLFAIGPGEG